ncbi:MAG: hypothetical protein ACHQFW_06670 [Chitinophagales bacterium]
MIRLTKDDPRTKKRLALSILVSFVLVFPMGVLGFILYPPDYSAEVPVYPVGMLLFSELAAALLIIAGSLMAIKLADEREVLPAGGFTIFSISQGLIMVTNFEIMAGNSNVESLETTFQMYVGTFMLAFPAILLISTYSKYPRWLNLFTLISVLPYITTNILFLLGSRDFKLFDLISSFSFVMQGAVFTIWGIYAWKHRYEGMQG